jgi:hypothetical protein
MRGTVAKKIRKSVYGDFSSTDRKYETTGNGVLLNTGLRKQYLYAKKEYYVKHRS